MDSTGQGHVVARKGFFPVVAGGDVRIEEGGGAIFLARRNLTISRGGGQWLISGGDQTIHQGGGAVLISRRAHLSDGFVALAVAGTIALDGRARVLVSAPAGAALVAVGAFVAGLLVGRRRRSTAGRHG